MSKYIITGATGHIGNVVARKLCEKGYNLTALVLPNEDLSALKGLNINLVEGDVTNREFIFKFVEKDSIVLHLAGIIDIGLTPTEVVERVNIDGTKNIVWI